MKRRFRFYINKQSQSIGYDKIIEICLLRVIEVETKPNQEPNPKLLISLRRVKELKDYIIANINLSEREDSEVVLTLDFDE